MYPSGINKEHHNLYTIYTQVMNKVDVTGPASQLISYTSAFYLLFKPVFCTLQNSNIQMT